MGHRGRRLSVLLSTAALAVTGMIALPAVAGEQIVTAGDGLVPSIRYSGDHRFDTAALIATDETSSAARHDGDAVVLARADDFPDALAGNLLAGLADAPLLLTGSNLIPQETMEALEELAPSRVFLLGQTNAISASVEQQLANDHDVRRIGGSDRFQTAARIAARAEAPDTAIVALGTRFPDALVAAPIAYAAGYPILLTTTGTLPQVSASALQTLGVSRVIVAGGTHAITDDVVAQIEALGEIDVVRIGGDDRFETAHMMASWAAQNLGFRTDHANIATGLDFPDALALGPHAGDDYAGPSPILLAAPTTLTAPTEGWLLANATLDNSAIHVAGGPVAISEEVERAAHEAFTPEGGSARPASLRVSTSRAPSRTSTSSRRSRMPTTAPARPPDPATTRASPTSRACSTRRATRRGSTTSTSCTSRRPPTRPSR